MSERVCADLRGEICLHFVTAADASPLFAQLNPNVAIWAERSSSLSSGATNEQSGAGAERLHLQEPFWLRPSLLLAR